MAQQGATLQNYNNELVKCIEDLREKREEVRGVDGWMKTEDRRTGEQTYGQGERRGQKQTG